jgi:hypothetical protein
VCQARLIGSASEQQRVLDERCSQITRVGWLAALAELAADERLARDREGDLAGARVAEAAGAQRDQCRCATRST